MWHGRIGKDTLATKIYNGEAVERCFKYRAWVCLSQQFQPKTTFQRLLKQLLPNESEEQDEDTLVRKLYQVQRDRKCLLVLDDVWEGTLFPLERHIAKFCSQPEIKTLLPQDTSTI